MTGGPAPEGYVIRPDTPWAEIISEGVKHGHITLDGDCQAPIPVPPFAMPAQVGA
jgi:hypothetical protein